jgi:NAD(P)-dependent dehydrogenase (short-subunit alcohol dehydrogenase family)
MPRTDGQPRLVELISLAGRRALITGGARGLGLAAAYRFAEAGAAILMGDKNADGARQAASEIGKEYGTPAFGMALDVVNAPSVAHFADEGVRLLGGIDIWLNNAGIYPGRRLLDTEEEFWDLVHDVNLRGTFLGCREAARRMVEAGRRPGLVIINVASVAGVRGRAGLTHYSAAKSGVIGLTRGAAVELAPHGIRVLCLVPSLAETPGSQEMRAEAQKGGASADTIKEMERRVMATFPMGRAGHADEIARVTLFCASDLAAFMTGSCIYVDGGLSAV